jgi:hypothetical protein
MAVDVLNATMVLVNLENCRFTQKREFAWNSNDVLTPKGKALRDKALKDIDVNDYVITVKTGDQFAKCSVRKVGAKYKNVSCKHTIGGGGRVAFWFMQLWCHSGNGCTLPAYGGSAKEWCY